MGERIDVAGAWQFPQGGVEEGETGREALLREVEEELGLSPSAYEILEERGGYRYRFPEGQLAFGTYAGQEQTYFLCGLREPDPIFQLETGGAEFRAVRWIEPAGFQEKWLPRFKQEVYAEVMQDFFGTALLG